MSDVMPETHRHGVAHNPYQGEFRRVLCVCSGGILRSPTLAWILSNAPYNCNTRAAGSEPYALVPVDQILLDWAHTIVFVNEENRDKVVSRFRIGDNALTLSVPDSFGYRDPELVRLLTAAVDRAFPAFIRPDRALTW